jgi:leucyl aminopeptidase
MPCSNLSRASRPNSVSAATRSCLSAATPRRLLLVGLGKRVAVTAEHVRQAAATAVKAARDLQVPAITIGVHGDLPLDAEEAGQAFAEGIELGAYRYWKYRTGLTSAQTFAVERATVCTGNGREQAARAGIATGQAIARGVMLARDLVNSPGYADAGGARRAG